MADHKVSTESIGRAGEYFTAYVLESRGIRAVHVDVHGHDLWVQTPSGRILTLQVKTAGSSDLRPPRTKAPTYRFYAGRGKRYPADLYVFVALELSCLLIEDSMAKDREIPAREFTPAAMNAGLARFLF